MSHSFNNDFSNTPEKERGLQQIKSEFNGGKMQAFKGSCSFQKLEKVSMNDRLQDASPCISVFFIDKYLNKMTKAVIIILLLQQVQWRNVTLCRPPLIAICRPYLEPARFARQNLSVGIPFCLAQI